MDLKKQELSLLVKRMSSTYGFCKVGISRADFLPKENNRLKEWVKKSYHSDMVWIERRLNERSNILNYFPDVKTVISLATNYFTGTNDSNSKNKISNYAWGDDYHEVIKPRLYSMLNEIKLINQDIEGIVCVDTSPIMEKPWAQRSGLGWIGKNTNLITRDYGSWIFLSEILLNIELDYDSPFIEDLCGSCTACIDECPTGALNEYILDSNKCISYHTIENRQDFNDLVFTPEQFNGYIYGCDICQNVCPWNIKFSSISEDNSFTKRRSIESIDNKKGWINLDQEIFTRTFKNSAVKRTKFSGLKRNIKYTNNIS